MIVTKTLFPNLPDLFEPSEDEHEGPASRAEAEDEPHKRESEPIGEEAEVPPAFDTGAVDE